MHEINGESFKTWLQAQKLQVSTITQYLRSLQRYKKQFSNQVSQETVTRFVSKSKSSVDRAMLVALSKQIPKRFSGITFPKVRQENRKIPTTLSKTQENILLNSMPKQYALVVEYMLECGVRIQEAISLRLTDIQKNKQRVLVKGKGSKERYVYPSKVLLDKLLKKGRDSPGKFVWPSKKDKRKHVHSNTIRTHMKKIVEDSHPHKCRHTFAEKVYENTGEDLRLLQVLLGHANISTTTIYSHVSNKKARNAAEYAHLNK